MLFVIPLPQDMDVRYGRSSTVVDTELALVKPAPGAGVTAVSISPQSPLGLFGCFLNPFSLQILLDIGLQPIICHLDLGTVSGILLRPDISIT